MEASAYFGTSVALEADTVVAGALDDDPGDVIDAGAVYMVMNSGTLWSEEARLVASEMEARAYFGRSSTLIQWYT